jgi:voltage-gated sodium channel
MTASVVKSEPSLLLSIVESSLFQRLIIATILVNAVTLGLETSATVMAAAGSFLHLVDKIALGIFVIEMLLKLAAYRLSYFRSGWNLFDFVIVGISVAPLLGMAGMANLSVLRAFRILRVLRLLSVVPQMRSVIQALLDALPGMGSIVGVLGIIFYVSAVLATKLFGSSFPDEFGSLGTTFFTLFAVMTLEGWADIARQVMAVYPHAWLFFITFILVATFAVLNLFIAIIVNSMQSLHEADNKAENAVARQEEADENARLVAQIASLRDEVSTMKQMLAEVLRR